MLLAPFTTVEFYLIYLFTSIHWNVRWRELVSWELGPWWKIDFLNSESQRCEITPLKTRKRWIWKGCQKTMRRCSDRMAGQWGSSDELQCPWDKSWDGQWKRSACYCAWTSSGWATTIALVDLTWSVCTRYQAHKKINHPLGLTFLWAGCQKQCIQFRQTYLWETREGETSVFWL